MRDTLKTLASSGVAGTIGAVTGIYDLTRKFGRSGSAAIDMAQDKTRTLAKAAIALDVASVGVQVVSVILPKATYAKKAFTTVAGNAGDAALLAGSATRHLPLVRAADSASFALQIGAGMVEFEIARRKGDAERASNAIGNTVGGLGGGLGGAKLGAACGTLIMPGIGTAVGGFTGAVAGSWSGSKLGRECTNWTMKDWLQKKFA